MSKNKPTAGDRMDKVAETRIATGRDVADTEATWTDPDAVEMKAPKLDPDLYTSTVMPLEAPAGRSLGSLTGPPTFVSMKTAAAVVLVNALIDRCRDGQTPHHGDLVALRDAIVAIG